MSNDLTRSPLILDTAGSTIYNPGGVAVKLVRWVGGTTAGHTVVIQDATGRVLWTAPFLSIGRNGSKPNCLAAVKLRRAPQFVNPPLALLLLCRLRHAACSPVIAEQGKFALMGEDKKDSESKRESAKSDDQATEETPRSLADNRKRRDGDKDAREKASEVFEIHLSMLRRPNYPQCTRPLPSRARSLRR